MAKLDRLEWAAGIAFESYGLRIGVRTNTPDVLPRLAEYLPPGWTPAASPVVDLLYSLTVGGEGPRPGLRKYNLLYANSGRISRSMDLDETLTDLETDTHIYISQAARDLLFVHAGVVGWGKQAIVIPGDSHSGKTSLVAALVRAGASYYSDEYAVLDAQGQVHPFARPLSIRNRNGERQTRQPVAALGGQVGHTPLPVGLILVTRYKAGAHWRPRRLSQGEAALALMAGAFGVQHDPAMILARLSSVATGATALKGVRGEAVDMVDAVLHRVDR